MTGGPGANNQRLGQAFLMGQQNSGYQQNIQGDQYSTLQGHQKPIMNPDGTYLPSDLFQGSDNNQVQLQQNRANYIQGQSLPQNVAQATPFLLTPPMGFDSHPGSAINYTGQNQSSDQYGGQDQKQFNRTIAATEQPQVDRNIYAAQNHYTGGQFDTQTQADMYSTLVPPMQDDAYKNQTSKTEAYELRIKMADVSKLQLLMEKLSGQVDALTEEQHKMREEAREATLRMSLTQQNTKNARSDIDPRLPKAFMQMLPDDEINTPKQYDENGSVSQGIVNFTSGQTVTNDQNSNADQFYDQMRSRNTNIQGMLAKESSQVEYGNDRNHNVNNVNIDELTEIIRAMEGKIEHIQSSIDQKNAQRQNSTNIKQVRFEDSPDQKSANSSLNNSVMPMTSEDVLTAFNQVIKNQNNTNESNSQSSADQVKRENGTPETASYSGSRQPQSQSNGQYSQNDYPYPVNYQSGGRNSYNSVSSVPQRSVSRGNQRVSYRPVETVITNYIPVIEDDADYGYDNYKNPYEKYFPLRVVENASQDYTPERRGYLEDNYSTGQTQIPSRAPVGSYSSSSSSNLAVGPRRTAATYYPSVIGKDVKYTPNRSQNSYTPASNIQVQNQYNVGSPAQPSLSNPQSYSNQNKPALKDVRSALYGQANKPTTQQSALDLGGALRGLENLSKKAQVQPMDRNPYSSFNTFDNSNILHGLQAAKYTAYFGGQMTNMPDSNSSYTREPIVKSIPARSMIINDSPRTVDYTGAAMTS